MYNLLISHIAFSSIAYLVLRKKNRTTAIYSFLTILLLPILGLVFLVTIYLLEKINKDSTDDLLSYEKMIKNETMPEVISKPNLHKEINIVPLQEALVINDNKIKRSLLIDLVKENPEKHIEALNVALHNEDTETSHYAATAIMEIKKNFMINIQEASVSYENNKNLDTLTSYIEILKKFLESNLQDEKSRKKYQYIYSEKLGELIDFYTIKEIYYTDKINCDLELNEILSAEKYCSKFYKNFKNSEEPYIMYMKLYYKLKDFKNFNTILNLLKNSDVKLTNNGLNIVRFWTLGDINE